MLSRCFGAVLGFGAHGILGVTVWYLFPFLMGGADVADEPAAPGWWWCDTLLVLQFGLSHSLLLLPATRTRIERVLPSALHGVLFTVVTCVSLLILIHGWQPSGFVLGLVTGPAALAVHAAYLLSWLGLLYSVCLTGAGFQTGWTPFWAWLRGMPSPRRRFEVRGAYRWLRHPVYLSFLGLVWFTPVVTGDRALFIGLMTAYVFIGSHLKDCRLVYYLGTAYREYQMRVPGYPVIGLGPLGRRPAPAPVTADQ